MTQVSLFAGLVHTLEGPRERPMSGDDESGEARPVTMPPGAPDDTPAPSPSIEAPGATPDPPPVGCDTLPGVAPNRGDSGRSPSPSEPHIPRYLDDIVQFFKARPNQWISALTLEQVAGRLSWRTRVSECRTIAGMQIRNRQRHSRNPSTHKCWCVSEYRYEP